MSFATRRGQIKSPDSMAQVVGHLLKLHSALRKGGQDHIHVVCTQASRAKTYFIAGSSHPQNTRTVHISPAMTKDSRQERNLSSCSLVFYKGTTLLAERNHSLPEIMQAVEDCLVFLDAGEIRKHPHPETQRKGES